jgi:hypothetical protein
MNVTNYQKWLTEKLIPNLPPKSVLVVDNAPYHNQPDPEGQDDGVAYSEQCAIS